MEFRNGSLSCRANPKFVAGGMYLSPAQIARIRADLGYSGLDSFSAGFGDHRLVWVADKSPGAVYRWHDDYCSRWR
jgi:hypothetical protein